MGEVYRATDTNLKRQVAIKVLPAAVAGDAERLARFQREAEVLAALNHPNIAQIHGLEKPDGTIALVMELVEGPTLADRIARGAIPIDEALPIAKQIAEALEAAHEQGIIHRDLKPANIKVRSDGTVKVLDFGLAKALEPVGAKAVINSMAPTITTPAMTQAGMILGTAAYMSPEQARGKVVDKRADIWAFGAVLYEMLTGQRAFPGEDLPDTLAAVVKLDPKWDAVAADVPARVHRVLRVCLQKDPRQRAQAIGDVRLALEGAFETPGPHGAAYVLQATASTQTADAVSAAVADAVTNAVSAARAALAQSMRRRVLALTAGAVVLAAVVGAGVWFAMRPAAPVPPRVTRTTVSATGPAALALSGVDRDLAITPDGTRVVYVGNRGTQLFVRALDALAPVAVFTGQLSGPFLSPDGEWIGFVDANTTLKKVAVTGGPAVTLARLDGGAPLGATWAPDDTIVFATQAGTTGLQRVGAAGGPVTVLTRSDRAQGEADHVWPEMLPGGRAVLFTITAVTGGLDAAQVAVLDLQTGMRTILVRGGSHAHYVSSDLASPAGLAGGLVSPTGPARDSGHLVYAAAGTRRAVPFDLATLTTRGTPVPVVPDVVTTVPGAVDAVVAGDGTLAYVSGTAVAGASSTLVWVDRQGRETPIPAPPRAYFHPRLSPDGTRVAVYALDQEQDLWLWDLARTTLTRVTFDPGPDIYPVWTPEGRRLLFSSERAGSRNLFWQAADGTGAVERLTESPNTQHATAMPPDGRRLIFTELAPTTGERCDAGLGERDALDRRRARDAARAVPV